MLLQCRQLWLQHLPCSTHMIPCGLSHWMVSRGLLQSRLMLSCLDEQTRVTKTQRTPHRTKSDPTRNPDRPLLWFSHGAHQMSCIIVLSWGVEEVIKEKISGNTLIVYHLWNVIISDRSVKPSVVWGLFVGGVLSVWSISRPVAHGWLDRTLTMHSGQVSFLADCPLKWWIAGLATGNIGVIGGEWRRRGNRQYSYIHTKYNNNK